MGNSLTGGGSLRPTDLAGQVEKVGGKDRVIKKFNLNIYLIIHTNEIYFYVFPYSKCILNTFLCTF